MDERIEYYMISIKVKSSSIKSPLYLPLLSVLDKFSRILHQLNEKNKYHLCSLLGYAELFVSLMYFAWNRNEVPDMDNIQSLQSAIVLLERFYDTASSSASATGI